jgi:hypothetical protein
MLRWCLCPVFYGKYQSTNNVTGKGGEGDMDEGYSDEGGGR